MPRTNTDRAQAIAANYIFDAANDAEMTLFATTGHADGWRLLECIERNVKQFADKPNQYNENERANIASDMDYLRAWVHEYHGRYALRVEHVVWPEGENSWGDEGVETTKYPMFERLSEVATYMAKQLLADGVDDDIWTMDTLVRSNVSEYWTTDVRDHVAAPVYVADQYTVSAAYGFTDRTWCWVIFAARTYFHRNTRL